MDLPTEERLKKYLDDGDSKCPFCGCAHCEGGSFDQEANQVWQILRCTECEESWTDIYVLKKVEIWREGELVTSEEI